MRRHELICGAGMAFLLAAFSAHADLAKWDQARVTELAQQLSKAADGWQQAILDQDPEQLGSGNAEAGLRITNRARFLQDQARTLAEHLKKGEGYEKTRGLYDSLMEAVRDTQEDADQMQLDQPATDAWAKVSDLLRQIGPYYDPKAGDEKG